MGFGEEIGIIEMKRDLSVDNIQLAYGGITRIRASYYKDREGKPLHMYIYLNMK